MCVAGINSRKEVISAEGRADLVVEMPQKKYVFEFKLAKNESEEKDLLQKAVEQAKDKRYGEILPIKEITRIGVIISAKEKAVALWKEAESALRIYQYTLLKQSITTLEDSLKICKQRVLSDYLSLFRHFSLSIFSICYL